MRRGASKLDGKTRARNELIEHSPVLVQNAIWVYATLSDKSERNCSAGDMEVKNYSSCVLRTQVCMGCGR